MNTNIKRRLNTCNIELLRHKTNHVLHGGLTVITFGLWLPVWTIVTLNNAIIRRRLEVKIATLEAVLFQRAHH